MSTKSASKPESAKMDPASKPESAKITSSRGYMSIVDGTTPTDEFLSEKPEGDYIRVMRTTKGDIVTATGAPIMDQMTPSND